MEKERRKESRMTMKGERESILFPVIFQSYEAIGNLKGISILKQTIVFVQSNGISNVFRGQLHTHINMW